MEFPFYDIINKNCPVHMNDAIAKKYPQMRREDRAKIFAPFAALHGHAEQTHAQERVTTEKYDLSETVIDEINFVFRQIEEKLDLKQTVNAEVVYFVPDDVRVGEGVYRAVSGEVEKIDVYNCVITVCFNRIEFENIYRIKLL